MALILEFPKGTEMKRGRILPRDLFLFLLDFEVKKAKRYQEYLGILNLKLSPLPGHEKDGDLATCYQTLSSFLIESFRESDIFGSLGVDKLAILLPYSDSFEIGHARSRIETDLKNYEFKKKGYEILIDQICFPMDGTDTADLVGKL